MDELKIAIIGWGTISHIHAQAILSSQHCELCCVYSSSVDKNDQIKANYSVQVFNNYDELLKSDLVDAVAICTPSGAHLNFAVKAANAGKCVIIEKPIEVTLARAQKIIEACHRNNVTLSVIYQNRFSDAVIRIKDILKENKLGKIFYASGYVKWYRSQDYYDSGKWRGTIALDGGGALMNQAIHTIDLLVYLVGDIKSVCGFASTFTHERIEVEDSAVASLRYENGAIGVFEASTSIKPAQARRIEIHGENGTIILDGDLLTVTIDDKREVENFSKPKTRAGLTPSGYDIMLHQRQYDEIAAAIQHETSPMVNGEESIKSLAVVNAIYESNRTGKIIDI
ncbi:MAG: Gfo/Idh/MocA family protein [bacterium]